MRHRTIRLGAVLGLAAALTAAAPAPKRGAPRALPRPPPPAGLDKKVPPANPYLEEARRLYERFELENILTQLELALAVKGITTAERLEVFRLMAFTHAAFDDAPAAEAAILKILEVDEGYELTGPASPKIRALFAKAQKTHRARKAVALEHQPPRASAGGSQVTVDVRVASGEERVASMTLHYRPRGGTGGYSQLPLSRGEGGAFSGSVPNVFPGPAGRRTIEYFVRARDAAGGFLAGVGEESRPLELVMETVEASQPIYKSWVFWSAVGVVAATAAAAPFLVPRDARVQPGSLGLVQLP